MRSMTGYARATATVPAAAGGQDVREVCVEMRSVNNRYLDLSVRLPRSLTGLEERVRRALTAAGIARGKLDVTVDYTWNDDCELGVHYMAVTDKPTLCNMTNHAYFNLDGHDAGTVENLTLQINADCVTEADPALIPTGRLLPQKGLAYDFTEEIRLGDVLARTPVDPVMRDAGGVDFNYCAGRDRETKLIATLRSPKTGRRMDVITDQPGVQCYTGQGLDHTGKGGVHYGPYAGVCLETQHYPDAIHQPHFESYVLRPQDKYDTFTIFRFTAE